MRAPHLTVTCAWQVPTFNTTLRGRVLLDLFSEPDIFNIKWDALTQYNGIIYPALPDLYGPTMNVGIPVLSAGAVQASHVLKELFSSSAVC